MAAVIARAVLSDLGADLQVLSAGLATSGGQPASAHAAFVVAERGGSLENHRTTPVSDPRVQSADLFITMTQAHRDALVARWPDLASRAMSLGQAAGEAAAEIPDPFGGSLEEYEATYAELERLIAAAANRLRSRLDGAG